MKRFSRGVYILLLVCAGCSRQPQILPNRTPPVPGAVIAVSTATVPTALSFTGVIAAQQAADISSQILAPIAELRVREGDRVAKGQVLVRLSSAALAAGVQEAESQAAAARQQEIDAAAQELLASETFARYQTLDQRHSVTPHEFDLVRTGFAAAQARHQAAAAQVQAAQSAATQSHANQAFTAITAPFAGVVTAKFVDAGATATPGTPLLRIEDMRRHEVDIQVNESMLAKLRPGIVSAGKYQRRELHRCLYEYNYGCNDPRDCSQRRPRCPYVHGKDRIACVDRALFRDDCERSCPDGPPERHHSSQQLYQGARSA